VSVCGQALQLAQIAAQRHAEHIRADFPADALRFELARELDEHLIGDVRDRRANTACGGELRDQHRHLSHDRADEQLRVHG
jgi:hypothetical protein